MRETLERELQVYRFQKVLAIKHSALIKYSDLLAPKVLLIGFSTSMPSVTYLLKQGQTRSMIATIAYLHGVFVEHETLSRSAFNHTCFFINNL